MKPAACPSCRQIMAKHRFERTLGGEVVLDLCFPCQGIWFDTHESLQITPGSIISLFRLLHEHRADPRQPLNEPLRCPRCEDRLLHGIDMVKNGGKFNYHRCLQNHGRFTTFGQFMIEKGFVRQLNPAEVQTLAVQVGTIRCSGCGSTVDIRQQSACSHCAAPIATLDADAVEKALARYQKAESERMTPPNPTLFAEVLIMQEREKSRRQRQHGMDAGDVIEAGDLLLSGVGLILGLLKN